jgi:hypothetical protein
MSALVKRPALIGYGNGYMRARMWAQYADGHAGVCPAFDQAKLVEAAKRNERPGVRLYKGPVHYRSEEDREILIQLPLAEVATDLHGLVDGLFPSVVAGLYVSKAWDWSTESEYRFLLRGAVADFEYSTSAAESPVPSPGTRDRPIDCATCSRARTSWCC